MTQIIDAFMLAGEEISYLSSSTKMILMFFGLTALIISIIQIYESYKELKEMFKADRVRKRKLERLLQEAEHQAQGINMTPAENINQHKIRFK